MRAGQAAQSHVYTHVYTHDCKNVYTHVQGKKYQAMYIHVLVHMSTQALQDKKHEAELGKEMAKSEIMQLERQIDSQKKCVNMRTDICMDMRADICIDMCIVRDHEGSSGRSSFFPYGYAHPELLLYM